MRVSVAGEIAVAGLRRARRMTIYEMRLDDGSGRLKAVFFNQPFLKDVLARGQRVVLFGLVERDAHGLAPARHALAAVRGRGGGRARAGIHTGRIVPVYEKLGPAHREAPAPRARATSRRRCRPTSRTRCPPSCASGSA